MKIMLFGSIAEQLEKRTITIPAYCNNLQELKTWLEQEYPFIQGEVYAFAINKRIENNPEYQISATDEVALLPPFSGG